MTRWLASWALFWPGDWTSKLLALVPDSERWEWLCGALYTVYNRLMVASMNVQGGGDGPWRAPE